MRSFPSRCYQAIGSDQLAIGCYDELLGQSNVLPPFRKLIASAVHRKAEVLIAQENYDGAIETCTTCLRNAKDEPPAASFLVLLSGSPSDALSPTN